MVCGRYGCGRYGTDPVILTAVVLYVWPALVNSRPESIQCGQDILQWNNEVFHIVKSCPKLCFFEGFASVHDSPGGSTLQGGTWLWDDMTLNLADGSTLQCGMWLWDDMPFHLPKTSAILEFDFRFRFRPYHHSRHVILHQSTKFYPNWIPHNWKWRHVDFQNGRHWILGVQ